MKIVKQKKMSKCLKNCRNANAVLSLKYIKH